MDAKEEKGLKGIYGDAERSSDEGDHFEEAPASGALSRKLQGRHMQMIAIGKFYCQWIYLARIPY